MSEDIARIKFVKRMINSIEVIVSRHGSVSAALADEEEDQKALLMCLQQIGDLCVENVPRRTFKFKKVDTAAEKR